MEDNQITFTPQDVPVFEDFEFTPDSFQEGVKTRGLSNLTAGVVDIQSEIAPSGLFSYESLKDGTAPLLNFMPGYSDFPAGAEQRQLTDEQILPLFTNVQDFGGGDNAVWLSMLEKAKRTAPKAGGMTLGAIKGAQYSSKLPIPNPLVKLGAIVLGTAGGALFGDYLGAETSDFIFGEEYPVTPSLQAATNAAETLTYGISMLGTPWALPTKEGAIGAVRFLDNWKRVTQGGAKTSAGKKGYFDPARMAQLIAAEEALGTKMFAKAMGAKAPTGNLLTRFAKPDPTKGPLSTRIVAGIESGIAKAGQAARTNPYATLFYETLAVGGSGIGAAASEVAFPGSPGYRLLGEVGGAGLPPVIIKPAAAGLGSLIKGTYNAISDMLTGEAKVRFNQRMSSDAAKRLLAAMENSGEVQQNPELIDMAIRMLGEDLIGADGKPITETSLSSFFAAKGSPELARVWGRIEQELGRTSDELSVASAKGREAYIQGAKNAIISASTNGDVRALQASAFVAERLFHDAIANNLNANIARLNAAAERVMNRPRTGGPKIDLALKLHKLLDDQLKTTKVAERKLWDAVGEVELTSFVDKQGNEIDRPNFLMMLDTPLNGGGVKSASKGGDSEFFKALGGINEDIADFRTFFKVDGDGAAPSAPSQIKKFNEAYDASMGTNARKLFDTRFESMEITNAATKENIDKLAQLERSLSPNKFMGPNEKKTTNQVIKLAKLKRESMIAQMQQTVPDVLNENPASASRMYDIRSQLLEKAQFLRNQGKDRTAMKMERLADAVLDDLMNAPDEFGESYNMARAYTRARNDVFTRSFLGDLQDTTQKGGLRVSPEALSDKLFAGGSNATYLRIQDIINAGKFVATQGVGDVAVTRAFSIHETLENIVRDQQRKIMDRSPVSFVDPETGETITEEALVVNPKKLADYVESAEGQAIFRMFPQLKIDLEDAASAQRMFDTLGPELKALKASPATKAFISVLESDTENPASAVASALRSKKPVSSMNELLNLAKRNEPIIGADGVEYSPDEVMKGLQSAILDWSITRAGGTGYSFNPRAMQDALFGTIKGADPKSGMRISSWMLESGVIDKEHLGMIQKALKEMINVEEAFMTGDVESVLFKKPSGAKMFQARMIGATLGARSQQAFDDLLKRMGLGGGRGMGGGMVAASEGSKQTLNLFFRMPEAARVRFMGELMQDKRVLASFIQEAQTAGQQKGMFKRISSILQSFGVEQTSRRGAYVGRAASEEIQEDETVTLPSYTDSEEEVIEESSVMPTPRPVPTQPVALPTTPVASATPPVQPPVAQGPVDRSRYAALFPNDVASGMIRQNQGIGSLMG